MVLARCRNLAVWTESPGLLLSSWPIVALVVGILGVLIGGIALLAGAGKRQLA